jgi:hypothetical protein
LFCGQLIVQDEVVETLMYYSLRAIGTFLEHPYRARRSDFVQPYYFLSPFYHNTAKHTISNDTEGDCNELSTQC